MAIPDSDERTLLQQLGSQEEASPSIVQDQGPTTKTTISASISSSCSPLLQERFSHFEEQEDKLDYRQNLFNHHHSKQSPSIVSSSELLDNVDAHSSAIEPEDSLSLLRPSQLRHRHESAAKQKSQQPSPLQQQQRQWPHCEEKEKDTLETTLSGNSNNNRSDPEVILPKCILSSETQRVEDRVEDREEEMLSMDLKSSPLHDHYHQLQLQQQQQSERFFIDQNRHDSPNEKADLRRPTSPDITSGSPLPYRPVSGGALIRAKSYSVFESSNISSRNQDYQLGPAVPSLPPGPVGATLEGGDRWSNSPVSTTDLLNPEIVMPTRDWVKMQTRINTLEQELQYVTRTNVLLNQELDKLNGHLLRLTSEEGAGWRKEYEFLVQQVDLMHRQLQLAYSQGAAGGQQQQQYRQLQIEQPQPEMTRQLHAEVKDLTASLRNWQAAFQKADEQYRKKCDGERVLKQTVRERETQLAALVEKLSGYENEVEKSLTNYDKLARISTKLVALEGKKRERSSLCDSIGTSSSTADTNNTDNAAVRSRTRTVKMDVPESNQSICAGITQPSDSLTPGMFPNGRNRLVAAANVDQLTVSIMSWAALLATYMLS